jgi:hypothetical protein
LAAFVFAKPETDKGSASTFFCRPSFLFPFSHIAPSSSFDKSALIGKNGYDTVSTGHEAAEASQGDPQLLAMQAAEDEMCVRLRQ